MEVQTVDAILSQPQQRAAAGHRGGLRTPSHGGRL